jgi:hypothetical protein
MQNTLACRTTNGKDRRDFDPYKKFFSVREWQEKREHIKTGQETLLGKLQAYKTKEDVR